MATDRRTWIIDRLSRIRIAAVAVTTATAITLLPPAFAQAQAQDFPSRPLKIVVPFPAGSASDSAARILARAMGEQLKQPVAVENKPGANG